MLSRFAGAIREHELDGVVRVTSDCPLIDAAVVAEGVDRFRAEADDNLYLSNCLERTCPRGMDYEIFSGARLLQADEERLSRPSGARHVVPAPEPHRRHAAAEPAVRRRRGRVPADSGHRG